MCWRSSASNRRVRDEALVVSGGRSLHLDREVTREEYEELIHPLGAGVLASRLAGLAVERVLVEVSPFSFGPSHLGMRGGVPYPHCYSPVIERNTPLPVTRVESYATSHPYQTEVEIEIYQGEDEDALRNIPVGAFRVVGLAPREEPNEILCRMSLDVEGLLRVAAIEKATGKSKEIVIQHALDPRTEEETAAARERMRRLFEGHRPEGAFDLAPEGEGPSEAGIADAAEASAEDHADGHSGGYADEREERVPAPDSAAAWARARGEALLLVARSRERLASMHEEDREEAVDLNERIEQALAGSDRTGLEAAAAELRELLFFVEGR